MGEVDRLLASADSSGVKKTMLVGVTRHLRRGTAGCRGSDGWRGRRAVPAIGLPLNQKNAMTSRHNRDSHRDPERRDRRNPHVLVIHRSGLGRLSGGAGTNVRPLPRCCQGISAASRRRSGANLRLKHVFAGGSSLPHRAPGSPGHSASSYLSGKAISYYRPRGSAEVRQLIDGGFQAFNAGRLSEACHIFADKMLAPGARHHHRPDRRRRADAGRPRRLRHRADGPRPGRLRHQHRRESLSRSPLRAELHAAPRLAVPRRRRAVRAGHHPHLRRAVSGDGAARNRRRTSATSSCARSCRGRSRPRSSTTASVSICWISIRGAKSTPSSRAPRKTGVPDLHVVAGRQLDRHEHRLPRADERVDADDRSEPRRQRGVRDHPRGEEERLRDPRRRLAEEFLPAGAADAVGGLRHPQGRERLLHPDHDRPGRLGRPLGRDSGRSRELGQGQSRRAARHGRGVLRFDDRVPAVLRVRGRFGERPPRAEGARAQARRARRRSAAAGARGAARTVRATWRSSRPRSIGIADGHTVDAS